MSIPERFRVNGPHVIHEVIQGEAILVNLETGSYYSTDQAGALVWDLIEKGAPQSEILAFVAEEYAGDPQTIQEGVHALLTHLEQEGLIVADETSVADSSSSLRPSPSPGQDKPSFTPPILKKYTEMEDLLLLDPIHDVDDTGWPNRAADDAQ